MRKLEFLALFIVIIGAFGVRLYKLDSPVADWHAWRQADTSAVSRNFVKNGYDLLHPKYEDLSSAVSLKDNPQGYRFVEFPIYNAIQAGLFQFFGKYSIEQWGRLTTIFSSLFSIVFLYLLVKKYTNALSALFAAGFMAFVPYSIYYSRAILPDTSMVMAILAGTYFFSLWIDTKLLRVYGWKFILAVIFTACAILIKPYALFFTLPIIYLAFKRLGTVFIKKWQLWLFFIISIVPFVFWQVWMRQYPEGIPQNGWLFNGTGIRFKGAFFHWLFAQRIGEFILGYFGLPLVILGILRKVNSREGLFFFAFLASSLIYMFTLATGNVQHDYYQILILPTLAIFFGKGSDMILRNVSGVFNKYASIIAVSICVVFMLAFGWFTVRDFYNVQHLEVVVAGRAVDSLVSANAKVIAPYGGDTTLLYYTNRNGWPVFDRPLEQFIKEGATVMVFVTPTEPELNFKNYFETIAQEDSYIIYDLTKPLKELE